MSLPLQQYGLDKLFLFPACQDRADYERATGQPCPLFDPSRPAKYWRDVKAMETRGRTVVYERVLAMESGGKAALIDGKPFFEPLMLLKAEAATVNIPVGGVEAGSPGAATPTEIVPVPCRALDPEEELIQQWGGGVAVRNNKFVPPVNANGGFATEDRALLQAIARKVGAL